MVQVCNLGKVAIPNRLRLAATRGPAGVPKRGGLVDINKLQRLDRLHPDSEHFLFESQTVQHSARGQEHRSSAILRVFHPAGRLFLSADGRDQVAGLLAG